MKIGLFATCLIDAMRPQIAVAALGLLRGLGVSPLYPPRQTCCGQIAFNGGYRDDALFLANKCADDFADCDQVVFPSASCCSIFRVHGDKLCDPGNRQKISDFGEKCVELSEFLLAMNFSPPKKTPSTTVTFHDCCAGLRDLNIKSAPRRFLTAAGYSLIEMDDCEECCGFGGAFATKFGELSTAIGGKKCDRIIAANCAAVAMGDLGCILHLEGILRHRKQTIPVLHWAQMLAPV